MGNGKVLGGEYFYHGGVILTGEDVLRVGNILGRVVEAFWVAKTFWVLEMFWVAEPFWSAKTF